MEPSASPASTPAARLLRVFVALVSLHSIAVGLGLALLPGWAGSFSGFGAVTPVFFARQGGVFHLVLGIAYWVEHSRTGGVSLLVFAKCCATIFLGTTVALGDDVPWAIPVSALGDALMGLGAIWLHRRARAAAARPPEIGLADAGTAAALDPRRDAR
jgi:hypothetical protein